MNKKIQLIIFFASLFIYIFYYISAFFTHTLDIFFEHVTRGQDFFQIPNGAYSFLHGGTLNGILSNGIEPYTTCCGVNPNVYHPFLSLLIGIPLQVFAPWTSFTLWVLMHFFVGIIILLILWKKFKQEKYLYLALSIYLLNSYFYYEVLHAQYHFLLTFFILLLLFEVKDKDSWLGGLLFFFSLLIKPVGLLFVIPLILYKRFKVVFSGLLLFLFSSLPFLINSLGEYYFDNLFIFLKLSARTYNIFALNNLVSIPEIYIKFFGGLFAISVLLFQILKKPSVFSVIFLWISFQLIFYSLVFHYHYSILAPFFALGLLNGEFKIKGKEIIPIIMLTIPSPVIFFHLAGDPPVLPEKHLSLIALWSIFWLFLLAVFVLFKKNESAPAVNRNRPKDKEIV